MLEQVPQFCTRTHKLRDFAWYRIPEASWLLITTSSAAYSVFSKYLPGTVTHWQMMSIPLWNSTFFTVCAQSCPLENGPKSFYCPALARKGIMPVKDVFAHRQTAVGNNCQDSTVM